MPEDFLKLYFVSQDDALYRARFRALLGCLDAKELLAIVEYATFEIGANSNESLVLNSYLLPRIEEIPRTKIRKYIQLLVSHYQSSSTYRKRYNYVLLIRELVPLINDRALAISCCRLFLRSTYSSIRGNGYKLMPTLEDEEHDELDKAFLTFHDQVAYQVIVSSDYLDLKEKYFDELLSKSSEYSLWQLYKDIKLTPERLKILRDKDAITYIYVCAMRGISIGEKEARNIWDTYKNDDRKYVLITAFGKLKLWNLLTHII